MTGWAVHLERIRRRWLLVLVVTLAATAAAAVGPLLHPATWTGSAALTISSRTRSPEQDAVLARGYVDYFNQASVQQQMFARAGIGGGVSAQASLAVDSPIIYVRATAADPGLAGDAATRLATTFRDQVRDNIGRDQGRTLADLNGQLNAANAQLGTLGPDDERRQALTEQATSLQNRVNDLQVNTTNQLQDLQLSAGVVADRRDWSRQVGSGIVGGLLVGVLAALVLGFARRKLVSATEVTHRLRLPVLAAAGGDRPPREVVGVLDLLGDDGSAVLAVAGPASGVPAPDDRASGTDLPAAAVARVLARVHARRGGTAVLVQADLERVPDPALENRRGVAQLLADPRARLVDALLPAEHGMLVCPAGGPVDDAWSLFGRSRVAELMTDARACGDLVVVESPDSDAGGSSVCAAADLVVLAVELGRTSVASARATVDLLERCGARPAGVVLVAGAVSDLTVPLVTETDRIVPATRRTPRTAAPEPESAPGVHTLRGPSPTPRTSVPRP